MAHVNSTEKDIRTSGIALRITAVTILIMTVSALLMGGLVLYETNGLLVAEESHSLQDGAKAIALQLEEKLDSLRTDVRLLAGTPPITGIIRASHHGGWDRQDDSSETAWKQRLATLFAATLSRHAGYVQARYIGLADGGRELVRVDKRDGHILRITGEALQQKGRRDYLQEAIRLKPGEVYLSAIDLDREHGRVAKPHQPTVRAAIPIYDGQQVFGVVIVAADFSAITERLRQQTPVPLTRVYFTNGQGSNHIARPVPSPTLSLGRHYQAQDRMPQPAGLSGDTEKSRSPLWPNPSDENITGFVEAHVDPLRPGRFIGVLLSTPYTEVVHNAITLRRHLIILALSLVLAAALVIVLYVQRQVRPLSALTRAVERRAGGRADFKVPAQANRETQVLARALTEMDRKILKHTCALEEANREMESFSYSISHDLRAPLRAINSFSGILQATCAEKLDKECLGHLGRIRTASLRMSELIDGLLGLSRVRVSEVKVTEVDLTALGNEVVEELRAADPRRDVAFSIAPGMSARGDPMLLRALLQNLFGNAWKFTGRREDARIAFGLRSCEGSEVFYVRDNGAGFDDQFAGRLFQPFARLHDESEYPGTGIGLATVRRIVQCHNGKVWAEGKPGAGATVFFTLNDT